MYVFHSHLIIVYIVVIIAVIFLIIVINLIVVIATRLKHCVKFVQCS